MADLVTPEDWQVIGRTQAVLCKEGKNYRIYDGDGKKSSTNGLYINHNPVTADTGYLLRSGVDIKIGQNPQNRIELKYFNPSDKVSINTKNSKVTSLKNSPVVLGRDSSATLFLDAPAISRRHATIDKDNRGRYILRDHSTNGVFVNGQRVSGSQVLEQNADIRMHKNFTNLMTIDVM